MEGYPLQLCSVNIFFHEWQRWVQTLDLGESGALLGEGGPARKRKIRNFQNPVETLLRLCNVCSRNV